MFYSIPDEAVQDYLLDVLEEIKRLKALPNSMFNKTMLDKMLTEYRELKHYINTKEVK